MIDHFPLAGNNLLIDKCALQQAVDELKRQMGFVRDLNATAEQARALIWADGIRPEDRAFSREIIQTRCEKMEPEQGDRNMDTVLPDETGNRNSLLADKARLLEILEEQDKQTGFVFDPAATPQQARALMLAQGIRPEDNTLSCEIKHMRNGE